MNFLKKVFLIITLLVFSNNIYSQAGTNVAGEIDVNTTWNLSGSPYNLTKDVTIVKNAILTIEPGVIVTHTVGDLKVGSPTKGRGTLNANGVTFYGTSSFFVDYRCDSNGEINNCTFDNAYLWIENSSPVITNNVFKNLATYPINLRQDETNASNYKAYPTISGNSYTNVSPNYNGIGLTLDIKIDYTLKKYQDFPYYLGELSSKEYVRDRATLNIDQNVTIILKDNLYVGYSNASTGTLNADKVTFQSDGSFCVDYRFGSTGTIQNSTFDNAFLWIENSSPAVNNNTFKNLATYPLRLSQNSDAFVSNPTITGNTFTNVSPNYNGIGLTLDILTDYTLKLYQNYKYYLGDISSGDEYVRSGKKLTIQPNITIELRDNLLIGQNATSSGILNADAMAFTGNGSFYVGYRFGSTGTINSCTFDNAYVWIENSSPAIINNSFKNLATYPLRLSQNSDAFAADPAISGNTFTNISVNHTGIGLALDIQTNYTLKLYQDFLYYLGDIASSKEYVRAGKTLSIDPNVSIRLKDNLLVGYNSTSQGALNADGIKFIGNNDFYVGYRFGSTGTINNSTFDNAFLLIENSSPAITNNIFTNLVNYPINLVQDSEEFTADPVITGNNFNIPSNYRSIELSFDILTDYTLKPYQDFNFILSGNGEVSKGKTLTIRPNVTINMLGKITVGTSVTSVGKLNAESVVFIGASNSYINYKYGSLGTINNCTLENVYIAAEDSDPEITNCSIINGKYGIRISGNSNPKIFQSNFANLSIYAVENNGLNIADATYNYWGHPSGPTYPANPDGGGCSVSDKVNFLPFLTAPNGVYLPYIWISATDPLYEESEFLDYSVLPQSKLICKILLKSNEELSSPIKNIKVTGKFNNVPVNIILNNKVKLDSDNDGLIDQIPSIQGKDFVEFIIESNELTGNLVNKILEIKLESIDGFPTYFSYRDTVSLYFAKSQKLERTFDVSKDGYSFENNPVDLKLSEVNSYLFGNKDFSLLSIPMRELSAWGGKCFGYSATAGTYFLNPDNKPLTGNVFSWTQEDAVLQNINQSHLLQVLYSMLEEFDFSDNYTKVLDAFNKQQPVILGMKKQNEKHAVLATKLTVFNNNKEAFINVYDCNNTSENGAARLNYQNQNFKYGIYNEFIAIPGTIFMQDNIEAVKSDLISNFYTNLKNINKKIFYTACPVYMHLTNSKGQKAGYLDNGHLINNIEGAEILRIPTNETIGDTLTLIYVPVEDTYTADIKGFSNGQMRFEFVKANEKNKLDLISAGDIALETGMLCRFDENNNSIISVDSDGDGTVDYTVNTQSNLVTGVNSEGQESKIPEKFSLAQNYPNPFNPVTTINYSIPKENTVKIKIYDLLGNEIMMLVNEYKPAGYYSVQFNAGSLSSGVYFYSIEAGEFSATKKLVLMK